MQGTSYGRNGMKASPTTERKKKVAFNEIITNVNNAPYGFATG